MEWDAIGTFAMFLAAGAASIAWTVYAGYRVKINSELERERLRATSTDAAEDLRRELHDVIAQQQAQLDELNERIDFTERMLASGRGVEERIPPKSQGN